MRTAAIIRHWHVVLLVGCALSLTGSAVAAADPPPPALPTLSAAVPLQILLRTADGTPVPGIRVDLMPAAADVGGPLVGTPAQQGVTDQNGTVDFEAVPGAIWWARFRGVYRGQVLDAVSSQGQPPYGTTRGGGFVVQTALQEENDAPAPVIGRPAPAVETLAFVLLPRDRQWTPAIDIAPPGSPPQRLGAGAAVLVEPPRPARASGALPIQNTNPGLDLTLVWWLLPVGAAGGALLVTWRQHRIEQQHAPGPHREHARAEAGDGRGGLG